MKQTLHQLFIFSIFLTALGSLNVLGGCGFKLKQSYQFNPELKTLALKAPKIDTDFVNALERELFKNGIKLSEKTDTTLHILDYQQQKRAASINSNNARQTETRLTHILDFSLYHKDKLLIAPQSLNRSKEYINNNTNLSGKIEEEHLLQHELDRELIDLLLRRLENIDVDFTETKTGTDTEINNSNGT